jgi:amidase
LNATAPNIPFGISFAGALWSEESLIGFAYAFEQRTMVRTKVKPYIQPSIEIENVIGSY